MAGRDETGLDRVPAEYRASSAVALTYEDVAIGPAKRWREEGLALLTFCVENARAEGIDTGAARACASILASYARVLRGRTRTPDGGANGCACDPGNPLCSASTNGWCRAG